MNQTSNMEETILTKLREEHMELMNMLDQLETSKDYFRRMELFNKVKAILVSHMGSEERTIYSRLRDDISNGTADKLVQLSDLEHHEIKEYLQRLNLINFGSNDWLGMFRTFKTIVKNHFEAEEANLFKEAKEDFSREELIEIANDFEEAKHHLS